MFLHVSVISFTGEEFCLQRGRGLPTGGGGLPLGGGVCLQGEEACLQGRSAPRTRKAGGMHPTGMLFCISLYQHHWVSVECISFL